MMQLQAVALALAIGHHQHHHMAVRVDKAARRLLVVELASSESGGGGRDDVQTLDRLPVAELGRQVLLDVEDFVGARHEVVRRHRTTASAIAPSIATQARRILVERAMSWLRARGSPARNCKDRSAPSTQRRGPEVARAPETGESRELIWAEILDADRPARRGRACRAGGFRVEERPRGRRPAP